MEKEFDYFGNHTLQNVIDLALSTDGGTSSYEHRFAQDPLHVWIVRQTLVNKRNRFIECFEFSEHPLFGWGLRGWSEEEGFPFFDCPLDMLEKATSAVDSAWRSRTASLQAYCFALPVPCWVHSLKAIRLPNGEHCHDVEYLGRQRFRSASGTVFKLPPHTVEQIALEGHGIAFGRA